MALTTGRDSPSLCGLLRSFFLLGSLSSVSSSPTPPSQIVSYPLVPHHVQKRRHQRRTLQRMQEEEENTAGTIRGKSDMVRQRRSTIAQQVGALYQGYGTHYIDLWCGSPPQRQTVIVDTGSGVTAFPCSGCGECGIPDFHIDVQFDERQSSTFHPLECGGGAGCTTHKGSCQSSGKCSISMSYAEGSRWEAYEARDKCYIAGPHDSPLLDPDEGTGEDIDPKHASQLAFELVFGCQTIVTKLFKTQLADGIMGMDNRSESFWKQMFNAGKLGDKQQFALCFSRQPFAARTGTESGALTLGGTDPRLHSSEMVYTSEPKSGGRTGFFSVELRAVYLRSGSGGESAQSLHDDQTEGVSKIDIDPSLLNSGGIIVDSGTTDTYWNRNLGTRFTQLFKQLTGRDYNNNEWTLTEEELRALPTVLFQLKAAEDDNESTDPNLTVGMAGDLDPDHPKDIILAFPPSHYMEYDPDKKTYTSRFYTTERGGSVFGANSMMGHDVLFDIDNHRIGFAESPCDYTQLLTDNGYEWNLGDKVAVDTDEEQSKDAIESEGIDESEEIDESKEIDESTEADESNDVGENIDSDGSKPDSEGGADNSDTASSDSTETTVKVDLKDLIISTFEACESIECRGSVGGGAAIALCLLICVCRCFCSGSSRPKGRYQHLDQKAELEMNTFSSYRDKPDEEPDDEFDDEDSGDFEGDFR